MDKNTLKMHGCFLMLGIVAGLALNYFGNVRLVYALILTIPVFVFIGIVLIKKLDQSIDKKIQEVTTPRNKIDIPGIGEAIQYKDYWTIDLSIGDDFDKIGLMFDGEDSGPTARQKNLIKNIKDNYSDLYSKAVNVIRDEYKEKEEDIDLDNVSIYVYSDEGEEDFEIGFEEKDYYSDMSYNIMFKNLSVVGSFQAD